MFSILFGLSYTLFPTTLLFDGAHNDVGSGTAADPYQIATPAAFRDIARYGCGASTTRHCNAHFELTADIDLSDVVLEPIGTADRPFTGSFDGQGYQLRSAYLEGDGSTGQSLGLFGTLDGAVVRDVDIVLAYVRSAYWVGTVAGTAYDSDISGILVQSSQVRSAIYGGGLVGEAFDTELHDNRVSVLVSASASAAGVVAEAHHSDIYRNTVSGSLYGGGAAGIVGDALDFTLVMNNRSSASVRGYLAGGIALRTADESHLGHNLALGPVDGSTHEGGILATRVDFSGTFVGNYFSIEGTGISAPNVAETTWDYGDYGAEIDTTEVFATSAARLRERATYVGWDFRSSWSHQPGYYPRVRVQ